MEVWERTTNRNYLCCNICSTKVAACKFQSRAQNIKTHEASQLHQHAALKWQEIQDRRGVLQDFQAAAAQLTCCARGFRSSAFSVENFPYPEAIMEWLSAKKRRGIR
jgi:hypothetical protein